MNKKNFGNEESIKSKEEQIWGLMTVFTENGVSVSYKTPFDGKLFLLCSWGAAGTGALCGQADWYWVFMSQWGEVE